MHNSAFTPYREKMNYDFDDEKIVASRSSKDGRRKQCFREDFADLTDIPKGVFVDRDERKHRGTEESNRHTECAKHSGELEEVEECRRHYQSLSRPKNKPDPSKQTNSSPMTRRRCQDELAQAKYTFQSPPVASYSRSGPLRSIYDFTPQHPRDCWTDKATHRNESDEPVVLERIINKAALALILQRRQQVRSNFEEVPNRSPAYDKPGMRWGVPLCIYDYCPQKSGQGVGDAPDFPYDQMVTYNKSVQTDCSPLRKRHTTRKPKDQ